MIILVEPNEEKYILGCNFDCVSNSCIGNNDSCALGSCGNYISSCDKTCSGNTVCNYIWPY